MASLSHDTKANGYRLSFRDGEKRKRSIWLSGVLESKAIEWKRHVEHLLEVAELEEPPSKVTSAWIKGLKDDEHNKLASVGLVESRQVRVRQSMTLAKWCDTYIAERKDVKANTTLIYEKTKDCLLAYFGKSKRLRDIRPEDAKRWRIWLATEGNRRDKNRKTMADASVRQRTAKVKLFFNEALERGLVDSNPFAKLPSTSTPNRKRQVFVSAESIELCIAAAPDCQWRTIIALARYGGLRCPSELLRLKWDDVNLPEGRMTIHAIKTEHHADSGVRVCPIFPELRPYLEAAWWDDAKDGAVYVITRYRSNSANMRTTFERIIKLAGLVPWPKLFQNLRASRETELMAKYPAKDVSSWIGNSVAVAMESYAMPLVESFQRAIVEPMAENRGTIVPAFVPSEVQQEQSTPIMANCLNSQTGVFAGESGFLMGTDGVLMATSVAEAGIEPAQGFLPEGF